MTNIFLHWLSIKIWQPTCWWPADHRLTSLMICVMSWGRLALCEPVLPQIQLQGSNFFQGYAALFCSLRTQWSGSSEEHEGRRCRPLCVLEARLPDMIQECVSESNCMCRAVLWQITPGLQGWVGGGFEVEDSQGDAEHSSHFPAPQMPSGRSRPQFRHSAFAVGLSMNCSCTNVSEIQMLE